MRRSSIFIVKAEQQISHIFLVFSIIDFEKVNAGWNDSLKKHSEGFQDAMIFDAWQGYLKQIWIYFSFFFENLNVSTRADRLVTYLILLIWKRWRFDANAVSETLAVRNPFLPNVPFSSPLKTSQTKGFLMFSVMFSGGSKGNIRKKRL